MLIHFWVLNPDVFEERKPALFDILGRYPQDAQIIPINMPDRYVAPVDDPGYRWFPFDDPYRDGNVPLDERIALPNWGQLDAVLRAFPNPYYEGMFKYNMPPDGRYRLGYWWYWLFERHWSWRGMTNALTDYYAQPDDVQRMFRAVTDFYLVAVERAKREIGLDGIMISDDLGTQTGAFFSPAMFERFFAPYYLEVIDRVHALGMHIWLHACGRMNKLLPYFIEMGLDVVHPIQKFAMDYGEAAREFGGQISIWAGLDVQQVIPWGTPEKVRGEVRRLVDTFYRPEGRLLLAAGNALNEDCPLPNLEAFLDEAYNYGIQIVEANSTQQRKMP